MKKMVNYFRRQCKNYKNISVLKELVEMDYEDYCETENYYFYDFVCFEHSGSGINEKTQNLKRFEVNDILLMYRATLEDIWMDSKHSIKPKVQSKLKKLKNMLSAK